MEYLIFVSISVLHFNPIRVGLEPGTKFYMIHEFRGRGGVFNKSSSLEQQGYVSNFEIEASLCCVDSVKS